MQASSSSKKKNLSLFQQMLSRRDERDERLDAEGHAEVGGAARADTPGTMGGDPAGPSASHEGEEGEREAPHLPRLERRCSTSEEYGALERLQPHVSQVTRGCNPM